MYITYLILDDITNCFFVLITKLKQHSRRVLFSWDHSDMHHALWHGTRNETRQAYDVVQEWNDKEKQKGWDKAMAME